MFLDNSFIQSIKNTERWTVSIIKGEKHEKKKPLDFKTLSTKNRILGAFYKEMPANHWPLATLPEVFQYFEQYEPMRLSHATYQLQVQEDCKIILDIEPGCPEKIKQNLMKLPFEYAEQSMSGKGIHLGFTLPKEYSKKLGTKTVIKQKKKYYEILLQHFVTFTMKEIAPPQPGDQTCLLKLIDNLLKQTMQHAQSGDYECPKPECPDIPEKNMIIDSALSTEYEKTVEQKENDISVWEYSYLWHILNKIHRILPIAAHQTGHEYTKDEIIWLTYEIAKQQIPYRQKHDQIRDNIPYLLWRAAKAYANYRQMEQEKQTKNHKKG